MTWTVRRSRALVLIAAIGVGGCASTSPKPAFNEVAGTVKSRTGHSVRWDRNTAEDDDARKAVDSLLEKDLTVDAAVQVALLASPSLRSQFEELSISQADLVQAGLLKNPVFGFGRTAWEMEHLAPNLFATVEQDFLDIVTLPMRKRLAGTQLEATKLEVGDAVLRLAGEVRAAFYTAQAAHQVAAMRRLVNDAAVVSAELAKRQYEAGNMNDLALNSELALASQTRLDLTRSEGDATVERERLNKLMGVWGPRTGWRVASRLPELPKDEVPLDRLETVAIAQRLDIGAARREVQALDYALSLAKTTRWTGTLNVAVEAGRLSHNKQFSFGPSVAVEIPLFDQRQASIARLEAFKRQAENNLQSLAIDARADVRATRARVLTARAIVDEYGKVLVPLRENIVKFSQQQYDAMLLGVYQLLLAKQSEFETYRAYIEALRDYWIARSDLERTVGARLGSSSEPPHSPSEIHSPPAPTAPPPAQHSH
jgi:cobalt-zinc-cadmium efflux system outer membrane protein